MRSTKRNLVYTIFLWILLFLNYWFFYSRINKLNSSLEAIKFYKKEYHEILEQIELLESQIEDLNFEIENLSRQESNLIRKSENIYNYNQINKRIIYDIIGLRGFVYASEKPVNDEELNKFKGDLRHRINVLLTNLIQLGNQDPLNDERKIDSKDLAQEIRNKINIIQNPIDCNEARKLVCKLEEPWGFGYHVHSLTTCLSYAYFLNRTLIIDSRNWIYRKNGFEYFFQPISRTCLSYDKVEEETKKWGDAGYLNAKVLIMPKTFEINPNALFHSQLLPKKLSNIVRSFNDEPFAWFSGQFTSYLLQYNERLVETINRKNDQLKFTSPIVGVHVRRTDKIGTEASFHALEEYMRGVEDYYDFYEIANKRHNSKRRVFLATDEKAVLAEAKEKYPHYEFIFDESHARWANLESRYTTESAEGIITDLHFLSQCDYLVCTFSSRICRLAYELMQTRYTTDASWRFRSLDDIYYYAGQRDQLVEAIYEHNPKSENNLEINLQVGDIISINGNHWNGYSIGLNQRTQMKGFFPSYKIQRKIRTF